MTEPILFIINGHAGGGTSGRKAPEVIAGLRSTYSDLRESWTEGPGHATEISRAAWADGVRHFVAVGGDGTAYEVLNGLFPIVGDDRPTLGFLPLGTGNSFVRDFGVTDTAGAIASLRAQSSSRCDVIRATHDAGEFYYINLCSIGFSAKAGDLTNRRFKRLGESGYIAAVLITWARLSHPVHPVRLDGGAWDRRPSVLLSFSNSGYTGGTMNMAPGADVADGRLDVIRVGELSRPRFLATFPKLFAGTHTSAPDISHQTAKVVEFDLDEPVDCMVDGEVFRVRLRRLEVMPAALRVML
ncbi:MAG: diacylglycerol kinase (ATP) [Kiritimatiellia bacterium]|jgi:diacylglycerol kinase (ATP)